MNEVTILVETKGYLYNTEIYSYLISFLKKGITQI